MENLVIASLISGLVVGVVFYFFGYNAGAKRVGNLAKTRQPVVAPMIASVMIEEGGLQLDLDVINPKEMVIKDAHRILEVVSSVTQTLLFGDAVSQYLPKDLSRSFTVTEQIHNLILQGKVAEAKYLITEDILAKVKPARQDPKKSEFDQAAARMVCRRVSGLSSYKFEDETDVRMEFLVKKFGYGIIIDLSFGQSTSAIVGGCSIVPPVDSFALTGALGYLTKPAATGEIPNLTQEQMNQIIFCLSQGVGLENNLLWMFCQGAIWMKSRPYKTFADQVAGYYFTVVTAMADCCSLKSLHPSSVPKLPPVKPIPLAIQPLAPVPVSQGGHKTPNNIPVVPPPPLPPSFSVSPKPADTPQQPPVPVEPSPAIAEEPDDACKTFGGLDQVVIPAVPDGPPSGKVAAYDGSGNKVSESFVGGAKPPTETAKETDLPFISVVPDKPSIPGALFKGSKMSEFAPPCKIDPPFAVSLVPPEPPDPTTTVLPGSGDSGGTTPLDPTTAPLTAADQSTSEKNVEDLPKWLQNKRKRSAG